jgi:hypothetical protein
VTSLDDASVGDLVKKERSVKAEAEEEKRTNVSDSVDVATDLLAQLLVVRNLLNVDLQSGADGDVAVLVECLGKEATEELRVGLLTGAAHLWRKR